VQRDVLLGLLPSDRGPGVEEAVMSWFQEQIEQKSQDARREGHLEGLLEGQRALLLKQLRLRFGELPAGVVLRVNEADASLLDLWTERVLTAATLDDVLDDS
jgi:hypothetical protein